MIAAIAVLSLQDVLGKTLAERYSVFQMMALRSVIALVLALPIVHHYIGLGSIRTTHWKAHLLRSSCMLGAFLLYYRALRDLPLADATAIFFGAPFFMSVLSWLLLHEPIGARRFAALALGFVGVLIIVQPTGDGFKPAALLVLIGSVLYPLAVVTTRSLSVHDSPTTMLIWLLVAQTVISGLVTPSVWESPTSTAWAQLAGIAVLTLLGHLALASAFSKAPVAVLAPLEYSALVFAAVFGFVVWGDVPGTTFWIGAPIIVASSILSTLVGPPSVTPTDRRIDEQALSDGR
jgi:drug/metabolite transporter (DMT)-like permease